MSTVRFKELWQKYNEGSLQAEEVEVFESLLLSLTEVEIGNIIDESIDVDMNATYGKHVVFEQILTNIGEQNIRSKRRVTWVRYAAAAVILISSCLFLWKTYQNKPSKLDRTFTHTEENITSDILLPDNNHAILKLENGQLYSLTDEMKPVETDQVRIVPLAKGVYAFEGKSQIGQKEVFHIFETPKGVSNQLVLRDGTKVWLNASSKFEVSSNYNGTGVREVRLVGEAYFEVTHDEKRPFYVHTEDTRVEVLGTSFNVWARPNRGRVETTLAAGRVVVQKGQKNLFLTPGEQALTRSGQMSIEKRKVDVDRVLAWKKGYFNFVNSPIEDILEELADWYDIEQIEWQNKSTERLTVSLARTRNLAELLDKIEMISNVKLTIKERRILVN